MDEASQAPPPYKFELNAEQDLRRALYQKLLAAQKAAPNVAKLRQTQETGQWAYASHEDVVNALVPVLLENDLVLTRSLVRSEDFETKTSGDKPKLQWMHTAQYLYTLTDATTGYQVTFMAEGRSMNTDDRGAIHAIPNAEKPFLLGLLMTATEDRQKAESQPAATSRKPRQAAQGRQQEAQAPRSSTPVGVKHHGGPKRIQDAEGKQFKRHGDDFWVQAPEGLQLPSCKRHDGGAPMMELPPGGRRYLCVVDGCGQYLDLRDEPATPPVGASPPAAAAAPTAFQQQAEADIIEGEVERLVKQRHIYQWQWDAIKRGNPELDCDLVAWGPKRWTWVLEQLRRNYAGFIAASLERCAKDTAAAEYRCRHLHQLAASQEKLPMAKRAEVEEAIKSNWHDAVEELIDQLETKRTQGELQIGAAVPRG